ncbi:hypothetical protein F5887DRAFT_988389 [Amanita rubescens]|nr:hypothetical protein F5887DRAFT_988389 [Amanita rubescens]
MEFTGPTDATENEDEAMNNHVWSGNRHRKLWKSMCTRAALNSNLPNLSTPPPALHLKHSPSSDPPVKHGKTIYAPPNYFCFVWSSG